MPASTYAYIHSMYITEDTFDLSSAYTYVCIPLSTLTPLPQCPASIIDTPSLSPFPSLYIYIYIYISMHIHPLTHIPNHISIYLSSFLPTYLFTFLYKISKLRTQKQTHTHTYTLTLLSSTEVLGVISLASFLNPLL